jgi:hypothetical protein
MLLRSSGNVRLFQFFEFFRQPVTARGKRMKCFAIMAAGDALLSGFCLTLDNGRSTYTRQPVLNLQETAAKDFINS